MSSEFCYWDVRNLPDAVIISCYLLVSVSIIVVTCFRLKSARSYGDKASNIVKIYLLALLWAVTLSFQWLYGVFVYFLYIQGEESTIDMLSFSQQYSRIDIIPGFTVQTIFLFICYLFLKGMVSALPLSQMLLWQRKFMKVLKIYSVLRILAEGTCIILINIFSKTQLLRTTLATAIWILIVDCAIINFLLLASLKIFRRRLANAGKLSQQDFLKLKKQYTIMIVTSLLRILIDLVFLIIIPYLGILKTQKCVGGIGSRQLFRTIIYNGVGNVVNHLLPMLWILKIYNISSYQADLSQKEDSDRINLIQSILKTDE